MYAFVYECQEWGISDADHETEMQCSPHPYIMNSSLHKHLFPHSLFFNRNECNVLIHQRCPHLSYLVHFRNLYLIRVPSISLSCTQRKAFILAHVLVYIYTLHICKCKA